MSTPRGGSYCSPAGAEGETAAGTPMVCSIGAKPGDRARWRRNGPAPARKARKPRATTSISVAPQPAPTEEQPMLPDPTPVHLQVTCDGCGASHPGESGAGLTVQQFEDRMNATRAYLTGLGWQNAGKTDMCPACLAAMSPSGGPVFLVEDEGAKVFGDLGDAESSQATRALMDQIIRDGRKPGIIVPDRTDQILEGGRGMGKNPASAMLPPVKAGDYLPATPERENTWGGMPGDPDNTWRHHWDGAIPRAADGMGQDQHLNVDGQPLGDVLRRIATDVTRDKMAPRDAWDRVAQLRDRVPADSRARRALDYALEDMGPRDRELPAIPDGTPAPLATLVREMHAIPLACREGGELDRVVEILGQRRGRAGLAMALGGVMGGVHESTSDCGYQQMTGAVQRCLQELRGNR